MLQKRNLKLVSESHHLRPFLRVGDKQLPIEKSGYRASTKTYLGYQNDYITPFLPEIPKDTLLSAGALSCPCGSVIAQV